MSTRVRAERDLRKALMSELTAYETEIMSQIEGASDKNAPFRTAEIPEY